MLFNLCLAIITITAHASPHYITVWIHFAGALFRKNTRLHAHHPRQAAGRTAEDGKQHGKLCRGWPSTLRGIGLWFTLGTCEAILDSWSWHTLLTIKPEKIKDMENMAKKQIVNSYCCLIVSGVFISAALRYARGDEQQRLLAVWRFKNRWCGVE